MDLPDRTGPRGRGVMVAGARVNWREMGRRVGRTTLVVYNIEKKTVTYMNLIRPNHRKFREYREDTRDQYLPKSYQIFTV